MKKTVMTITGIRPDFIRMSEVFRKLDENFNHILVHTGQHFDKIMSDVFFKELEIRKPDFNLKVGGKGHKHYHQLAKLSVKIIELIESEKLKPDMILFLGDANSVGAAFPLKKEGYKIAHIEAGMRSGDKRMLEEINRTVCDHCSDIHFCYHKNYKQKLIKEGLPSKNIFVISNTIIEPCKKALSKMKLGTKENSCILLDIHRPENFKYGNRLKNIIKCSLLLSKMYDLPVKMLNFKRTMDYLKHFKIRLKNIEVIDLMSYMDYIKLQYHSKIIISDSGSAQEEAGLLDTPVLTPRDFTERPESVENNCSIMIDVNTPHDPSWSKISSFISKGFKKKKIKWLGTRSPSDKIIKILKEKI